MPKAYVIFTEAIKDRDAMDAYGRAAAPTIAESGARVLAVDPQPQPLEGEWHGDQTVVLEFDSVEAARAWYESATYQKAKELRQAAADTNAVIISGFDVPA
ncbi:Uncharacterized conserved protein, DUF1330 family [Thermomonospora echinospora]|uniref:Uncharacterized conserved protein, DUF1330 family n=1 Tax=Thermomonospora echinospora TaxID=1992 RepID=A0A1H6AZJ7_9ACTN|nr:DUF1330 domain-containing protein [Thermomonospora echinospora]SEG53437.1 Uncharacterized conserved protein, DUF1330 family [Thermomonospora echinospora]